MRIPHLFRTECLISTAVDSIAAGRFHTLFLDVLGNVWSCGRGKSGQLGLGSDMRLDAVDTPKRIELPNDVRVTQIECGALHSVLRSSHSRVFSFGCNMWGQLGQGMGGKDATGIFSVPREVRYDCHRKELGGVTDVACGPDHTLAVTNGGTILCWGANPNGQLGTGSTVDEHLPCTVSVRSSRGARVFAGGDFSFCWMTDDQVSASDMQQSILQSELRDAQDQMQAMQAMVASFSLLLKTQQVVIPCLATFCTKVHKARLRHITLILSCLSCCSAHFTHPSVLLSPSYQSICVQNVRPIR